MEVMDAIREGQDPETICCLINSSGDFWYYFQDKGDNENTALHLAIALHRGSKIILALIENGADVDMINVYGESPIEQARYHCSDPKIIQALIEQSNYYFHYAIMFSNVLEFDLSTFIEKGADVDDDSMPGCDTPLQLSLIYLHNTDTVLDFIKMSKKVNHKNNNDDTALHIAIAQKRELEIVDALINQGADINSQDYYKGTALHSAVEGDSDFEIVNFQGDSDFEIVNFLIEKGADLQIQNKEGNTAMHLAVEKKRGSSVIHCLLRGGADFTKRNNKGSSAFDLATDPGHESWFKDTFSDEYDRMKHCHVSDSTTLYDAIALRHPIHSYADKALDYLSEGHTVFGSPIFWSVVSSRAFSLRIRTGDLELVPEASRKVMDFLSDTDVANLLLAHRPSLKQRDNQRRAICFWSSGDENLSEDEEDSVDQNLSEDEEDSVDENLSEDEEDSVDEKISEDEEHSGDEKISEDEEHSGNEKISEDEEHSGDENISEVEKVNKKVRRDEEAIEEYHINKVSGDKMTAKRRRLE